MVQWAGVHGDHLQDEGVLVDFLQVNICCILFIITWLKAICYQFAAVSVEKFDSFLTTLQNFFMAVSEDAKTIPALGDQLPQLETIVKHK